MSRPMCGLKIYSGRAENPQGKAPGLAVDLTFTVAKNSSLKYEFLKTHQSSEVHSSC